MEKQGEMKRGVEKRVELQGGEVSHLPLLLG